jgi:hypothetical protein
MEVCVCLEEIIGEKESKSKKFYFNYYINFIAVIVIMYK